ncbi:hypothetical protein [Nonomuraea sp. NPDC005650]|uniref:hypothetical protein n=1 Tax=Nonomuraea sp. NPDC005650 TaxID=3157045 RepID=UPI00339DC4E1
MWLVIMVMQIALSAVLLVAFSFTQLLAWARSPAGLNHELWALMIVFWLGITPPMLAFQAGRSWWHGHHARSAIITAWAVMALGVVAAWKAGVSWREIVYRPVLLAAMFWLLRARLERLGYVDMWAGRRTGTGSRRRARDTLPDRAPGG